MNGDDKGTMGNSCKFVLFLGNGLVKYLSERGIDNISSFGKRQDLMSL